MKKDFIIYNLRLARYLIDNGFIYKKTAVNINNPKYNVYYFEDSNELRNAVEQYKASK